MKITVKGYIGSDAVLRTVGEGENAYSVCDFNLAENIQKRDGATETVWTKVTLWRKYAETMAQYLTKGRKVMVCGEAGKPETYMTSGNKVEARVHINRNVEIDFMDRPETNDDAPWAAEEAEEV